MLQHNMIDYAFERQLYAIYDASLQNVDSVRLPAHFKDVETQKNEFPLLSFLLYFSLQYTSFIKTCCIEYIGVYFTYFNFYWQWCQGIDPFFFSNSCLRFRIYLSISQQIKIFNLWFPFWHRFLADLKASWTSVYPPTLFYANHILSHTHVSIFVSIEVYLHRLYVSLLMNRMFSSHGNQWISFTLFILMLLW